MEIWQFFGLVVSHEPVPLSSSVLFEQGVQDKGYLKKLFLVTSWLLASSFHLLQVTGCRNVFLRMAANTSVCVKWQVRAPLVSSEATVNYTRALLLLFLGKGAWVLPNSKPQFMLETGDACQILCCGCHFNLLLLADTYAHMPGIINSEYLSPSQIVFEKVA